VSITSIQHNVTKTVTFF